MAYDDICGSMVVTYILLAYIVVANIVMAYTVMVYIVMAYIVMAYIVMAYIVMACDDICGSMALTGLSAVVQVGLLTIDHRLAIGVQPVLRLHLSEHSIGRPTEPSIEHSIGRSIEHPIDPYLVGFTRSQPAEYNILVVTVYHALHEIRHYKISLIVIYQLL